MLLNRRKISLIAAVIISGAPSAAFALSAGCAAIDGTSYTIIGGSNDLFTGVFETGEKISILNVGGTFAFELLFNGAVVDTTSTPGASVISAITSAGSTNIKVVYAGGTACSGPDLCTATCVGLSASSTPSAAANAQAQAAAQSSVGQTVGLVGGRIQSAMAKGLNRGATGLIGFSTEGPMPSGAGGQGSSPPMAGWVDFGWTRVKSSEQAARSEADTFTLAAGVDTFLRDDTLVGGALAVSRTAADTPGDTVSLRETSIVFAPYAAYAIDNHFSIDGSAGYGAAFSSNEFQNGTIEGDAVNHRLFVALNANGRRYWDGLGLSGGLTLRWTHAFQSAYDLSDGSRAESDDFYSGEVLARLRPSYLFQTSDGVLIEPFASAEYGYRFSQSEINGIANDPDAVKVGAGVSVFGDRISGEVQARTELGRENQGGMEANANLRLDF